LFILEMLGDAAYRHVLFNHFPVIGLLLAFLVLLLGVLLRQIALLFTGLALVALTAGSSIPVGMFGDDAYPAVFDILDGDGRAWLDYHTHLADTWLPLLYANAAVAAAGLVMGAVRRSWLRGTALVVALVSVGGIIAGVLIAEAGGKVKHPEFRLDEPPRYESSRRLR
jgi:hypothetical protein